MAYRAKGEFTVSLKPVSVEGETPARFSIDKIFSGDLTGNSEGQMMAGGVEENGARVYVALETVTGALQGRKGGFILAHRGTMAKDGQSLSVIIVPDSGMGELAGISGELEIKIEDGRHLYVLDYDLP